MLQFWPKTWRISLWRCTCLAAVVSLVLVSGAMAQAPGTASSDTLTAAERAWLAVHPTLRLAPDPAYQPVEFFDEQGVYRGITADYMALIEQRLGLRFQIARVEYAQRQGKTPDETGIDLYALAAETVERRQHWSFTTPYLEFPAHLITRKSVSEAITLDDLSNARIAVVNGYAAREYLATQYPKLVLDLVPDTRTGLRKVSFGLVDAFVSDLPVATYWMEQEGITNLKVAGASGYVYRMGISTRKDWPELNHILEKGLAQITPEERTAIYQKWVKMPHEPSPFSRRLGLTLLSGLGVIGLGLLGVLLWNRALAAQVRQRTAELQQELKERREAEQALQESEEQLRRIIETSPECIKLVARDGSLLQMNRAGLRMVGARDINEIRGTCIYQIIAAEYREAFRNFNKRICAGEKGSLSFEIIGLDGTRRWIETFAVPVYEKKIGAYVHLAISRNVTDRKRAEEALQQSEALFRSLTESTSAWVFIEQNNLCCYLNAAGEQGIGYTRAELATMNVWTLVHPEDQVQIRARGKARCQGLPLSPTFEVRVLTKAGEVRWVQVTTTPIEYCGAFAILGTAFDITNHKQSEEQLAISAQQLRQLAGYLQTVREEERTAMAREIHDELGQALTALKMDLVWLNQRLMETPVPLQERIAATIELANATINSVRKLATQLRPGILDDLGLNAALEWQAQEFQTRTGIACEFVCQTEIDELEPECATAVFRICQEALTNVARHAQATRVGIRLQVAQNHLVLEVSDNGRGVTDSEWTNPRSLGLMGMRERAFLLGGEFRLTDNPTQGTTATARIPLSQAKAKGGTS